MADLERRQGTPNVGALSPEELRSVYEHPAGVTGQGTSVAILGNGATDSVIADLHAFDAEHGIAPLPVDVVHVPAGGDFSDTSGNIEWNIDMQAIHGMAPGISREVLYFAPSLADSELTAALGAWVNDPNGPPIMNASLGECEQIPILNPILNNPLLNPINGNGNPGALPVSQAVSQASEPATTQLLQQAVMEGRNFFAASGDNGSSCTVAYPGANGVANEGVPLTSDPANTPFTTGVGGTVLYSNGNEPAGRTLERAWEYSGGNSSPFIRAPTTSRASPTSAARARWTATASRPTPASCAAACRTSRRCRATRSPTATRSSPTARTPAAAAPASPPRCGRACGPTRQHRAAGRHVRVRQPVDLRHRQGPGALRAPPSPTSPPAPTGSTPPWAATTTSPASASRAWPG